MLGANCLAALFLRDHLPLDAHCAALDRVADADFDVTEISHPALLPLRSAPSVRTHADHLGLAVCAVHAPPMRRDPTLARQRSAALLAAELGARVLVVHVSSLRFASPDPTVRAAARDRDLRRLEELADFCQPLGVTLGLENGKRPDHADYLLSLLAALDGSEIRAPEEEVVNHADPIRSSGYQVIRSSSPAGLVFDAGHAALRGGDPLAVARRMLPRLLHTHLHDNHGARDEHLVPGVGAIQWPALLQLIDTSGYSGARLIELHPQQVGSVAQWERDLARAQRLLSREGR
jgi:sugar phosphate isomerase/epimerase